MTIHERVQELMTTLAVDDIAPADRDLAEQHLLSCARCRDDLDAFTALLPLLARSEPVATVSMRPARRHRRRHRRRQLLAATSAAILAAASLVIWSLVADRHETRRPAEVQLSDNGAIRGGAVSFDELADGVLVRLRLDGVQQPPVGGMYEAWLETPGGGMMSVGSFSPDGTGDVAVTLHGAGHLADFNELVVTIEPDMVDPGRNGVLVVLTDLPGH